jgi:FlaA1/EpsC-like NDP-sugar epimerase
VTTIEISEPVTLITDYILSIVVLIFGVLLFRARNRTSDKAVLLWSVGFLTAAAAAAAGGTFHGFAYYFSAPAHRSLWRVTLGLIAASTGFVTLAVLIQSEVTDSRKRWLRAGILLTFVGVVIQRSGYSPAANFNHNDLYHCIQTVAFYMLFRAAPADRTIQRMTAD